MTGNYILLLLPRERREMNLSTTIANVRFSSCLMNAAGALCVTREELEALGRCRSGAIVTKSMTPAFRQGNPEPRYYSFPGGSINSMGLPNLGYPATSPSFDPGEFVSPLSRASPGQPADFLEAARAIQPFRRSYRSQSLLSEYRGEDANRLDVEPHARYS